MNPDVTASGFSLQNCRVCLRAAADSYPGGAREAGDKVIIDPTTDTHVLLRDYGTCLVVAFRGSVSMANWRTDFRVEKMATTLGDVHKGFWKAMMSVGSQVELACSAHPSGVVLVTGHSLGAALALLTARTLDAGTNTFRIHSCYTFGQPRVGGRDFCNRVPLTLQNRVWRVTHGADIAPWEPPLWMSYRHVCPEVHFDAGGMHLNQPLLAKLWHNGLEIADELWKGDAAALTDHPVARYLEAVGQ